MADVPAVDIVDGLPTGGTGTVQTISTVTDRLGATNSSAAADPAATAALNAVLKGLWVTLDAMATDMGNLASSSAVTQAQVSEINARDEVIENLTTPASIAGAIAHDEVFVGPAVPIGGFAKAAAPADASGDADHVSAWFLRNGAQAINLTAAGALIPGDATNGLDIDVTRLPALVAGTALIGRVKPEGEEYETVAASQSAQSLGATGATGDYLSHVWVQPTSTTVGVVTVLDNAIEVHAYPGGTVSAALYPFRLSINAASVSGAWKITTGAGVKCTAYGNFT